MWIDTSRLHNSPDIIEARRLLKAGDRVGAATIVCKYDVVDPRQKSGQRKRAVPEHDGEDRILRPYDRANLINLTRDAERNSSTFRGMMLQLKLNVAGETKIQINSRDESFNAEATFYFNSIFSKECDALSDLNLNEICQLIVAARFREGDCLAVWDPFDDGEPVVGMFETDQLVTVEKPALLTMRSLYPWLADTDTCRDGLIRDEYGRVKGYAVNREGKHSTLVGNAENTTLYHRSRARLLYSPWRFDQHRGIPDFAAAEADVEDCYEMRSKELQSAKLASSLVFVYTSQQRQDAIMDMAESAELDTLLADDSSPASSSGDASTHAPGPEKPEHQQFGTLTGAQSEELAPGEDVRELNANRPNLNCDAFYKSVSQSAGAGVGLAKCFSLLEVDSSYTAFRGEMVMTWTMFRSVQKWLERHFLDWIGTKALEYAIGTGLLRDCTDPLWRHKISWSFPVMQAVDPDREASAYEKNLRNGLTTYAEIRGPEWKTEHAELARELDNARKLGLPLAVLSTVAGAAIEPETEGETE